MTKLKVLTLGILIIGGVAVTPALNRLLNAPHNELTQEKVVLTPAVPFTTNQVDSAAPASNKKKVIKTLAINPERTLGLFGVVQQNAEVLAIQLTQLAKKSKEPIVLLIDSPGGSVFSGEMLVSAIEASRADVYTVCIGLCASMAAIIHQYGTKRLATDRSILMFHDAAGMVGGRLSEMLSLLNMLKRKIDKSNHYIANRSGIPYAELVRLGSSNFWIDAEDAQQMNLVDGLVVVEE